MRFQSLSNQQRLRRASSRGFTLVELFICAALIGILGAIATYGVRKYIAKAYSAEALQNLGGIRRAVLTVAAVRGATEAVGDGSSTGGTSSTGGSSGNGNGNGNGKGNNNNNNNNGNGGDNGADVTHNVSAGLCSSADPVPANFAKVKAGKYQASAAEYATGDTTAGWKCLGFSVTGPQAYQYGYDLGGPKVNVELPHGGTPPGIDKAHTWTAWARGDRDGDGKQSWFVMTGAIQDGVVYAPPAVGIVDELE